MPRRSTLNFKGSERKGEAGVGHHKHASSEVESSLGSSKRLSSGSISGSDLSKVARQGLSQRRVRESAGITDPANLCLATLR